MYYSYCSVKYVEIIEILKFIFLIPKISINYDHIHWKFRGIFEPCVR